MKRILINRFEKWKKEAFKGMFIRKTILVRISVSRDNILKNRNNINRIKDSKDTRSKSADKNLKFMKKKANKENKVNNIKLKNTNETNIPQGKKETSDTIPIKRIYKSKKNPLFMKYKKNLKQNNNQMNATMLPNDNINNKYNQSFNLQNNFNNNKQDINYDINYGSKKQTPIIPILYKYEQIQDKIKSKYDNIPIKKLKNDYKALITPRTKTSQGYNSYTNVHSNKNTPINYHIKNKEEKTSIVTKKYNKINNNFSESKLLDKNKYFHNTYSKKNKRYISVDNEKKYLNHTQKADNRMKKVFDNEQLKKGITTVIQHYLGVRETFDNYNMIPN